MTKNNQQADSIASSNNAPHDARIERMVISTLLIESSAIQDVYGLLSPDMFYTDKYGIIYKHIKEIFDGYEKPDILVLSKRLEKSGELESIGGFIELAQLSSESASSANLVQHAYILIQLSVARDLALAGMEITKKAIDKTEDVDETLTYAAKLLDAINAKSDYNGNTVHIKAAVTESLEQYNKRKMLARQGIKSGITTGIEKMDKYTGGGWKGGQLVILAARPAMGKTALLLHFAKHAAINGHHTAVFSLEMSASSLTNRVILSDTNIDSGKFKTGYLSDNEEGEMIQATQRITDYPIYVDDTANLSIQKIKSICRGLKRKGQLDIVLIDYLQLIDMRVDNRSYNREQEVAQTSRACKIMAKELDVPVILLSQLSRAVESRADKVPILSDLRESGAIEQDADMVLFIHREEYYDNCAEQGKGMIRIAKQRDGITGDIDFAYNESLTRIWDYGNPDPLSDTRPFDFRNQSVQNFTNSNDTPF